MYPRKASDRKEKGKNNQIIKFSLFDQSNEKSQELVRKIERKRFCVAKGTLKQKSKFVFRETGGTDDGRAYELLGKVIADHCATYRHGCDD